jgi:glucose-1-phosphate adenylyltransferase
VPQFDLFNPEWPLRTESAWSPPAKFVRDPAGKHGRADDCLVAGGVVVAGGEVRGSLLARRVHVASGAVVESSVVLDNVVVGAGARVRNAIIDKDVTVPDGASVGWDLEADRARGFVVTPRGVVVVPKAYRF